MLKDRFENFEKERARRDREELEKSSSGFDWNEELFNSMYVYRFTADGHVTRNYKEEEDLALYENIIDESSVGEEVYLLSYYEGYPAAYERGWVVIYDVAALFSKVFSEKESILSLVDSGQKENFIVRFFKILKERDIKYDNDFFLMD